jgi:hypothetical protein
VVGRELDINGFFLFSTTNVNAGFTQTYAALKSLGFKTMQQLTANGWQGMEFDEKGLKL